ncbi:MAG: hypothetical protein HYX21_03960 [Candidatus Yanofskybacteria bacterium]|nr:hypothetical protein [Candidatus Yanofskybacteria bacterium]
MNLEEIKKVVNNLGGAVIFDKDGSRMVVLSYEKYLELFGQNQDERDDPEQKIKLNLYAENFKNGAADQEVIEKLNQDIAILKEEIRKKELQEIDQDLDSA